MLQRDSERSDFTMTILPEEYSSIQELPCLGALQFRYILEWFFACISSLDTWGKTEVEFLTLTSPNRSRENTNSVILITNGVGGGIRYGDGFLSPSSSKDRGL